MKTTPRGMCGGGGGGGGGSAALTSYQQAFLSKYGNLPGAEPSGGIKWNKTAGLTPGLQRPRPNHHEILAAAKVATSTASAAAAAAAAVSTAASNSGGGNDGVDHRGDGGSGGGGGGSGNSKFSEDGAAGKSGGISAADGEAWRRGAASPRRGRNLPPQTLLEAAAASADKRDAAEALRPAAKKAVLGGGKWTKAEDALLRDAVKAVGPKNWRRISAEYLHGQRSDVQCLHRWQKVLRPGLVKGPWTPAEDAIIIKSISDGLTKWSEIAEAIPGRIGKQCRERWFNHLDPRIKKGPWTPDEDQILIEAQARLGNRWCEIAKMLPGRSENNVKNRWNSAMRRRYQAKKANEDGSVNPPSPAKKRTRKKVLKKKKPPRVKAPKKPRARKTKAGSTRGGGKKNKAGASSASMMGPAPIDVKGFGMKSDQLGLDDATGGSDRIGKMLPPDEPWTSPFGFGDLHDATDASGMGSIAEMSGGSLGGSIGGSAARMFTRGHSGVQTLASGVDGGAGDAKSALSPVSRAFAQRANDRQKAQNRTSLTERERQLMHQAFLAGAAVSRQSQRPGYDGNPVAPTFGATSQSSHGNGSLQWNFGKGTSSVNSSLRSQAMMSGAVGESSVDIPSIAAFSALGDEGMVHTDIDRVSKRQPRGCGGGGSGGKRGGGAGGGGGGGGAGRGGRLPRDRRSTTKSNNMPPPASARSDTMDISWGMGSVGAGGGGEDLINSAEMNDMSLSMLGLSIDGAEVAGKLGGSAVQGVAPARIAIPAVNTRLANAVRGLPVMSPTATILAEISGEFKLGRITLEEKQRRKEAVLAAGSSRE
jgi:hypothetical protein